MSYFSELYGQVRYPIASEGNPGLRNAQLGAIHAIASHTTLNPHDSAIVVMPTGSGKTAVLMLAPYVLRKTKVLVVTPSTMVRSQIYEDFKKLRTLKELGVFSEGIENPTVFEAKHTFSDEQEEDIISADVVIASHLVAESISNSKISLLFDYVVIDEAHHVPAHTWQKILLNMSHSDSLLVTATPFRLDKKTIKGSMIYNYPLSKAYQDGIFGSILYIPIQVAPDKDYLIAKEAERVLLNDRLEGFDHYLMVRTDTKEKAKQLQSLYTESTSLKLERIDSSMTYSRIRRILDSLKSRELDGIICVDMLGEGFDFPNMKIAAVHNPQKSLASTLQFVGRFARTNAEHIGQAKFIAMNDDNLRISNQRLYSNDAIWQDLIINMSEGQIENDIEDRKVLESFSHPDDEEFIISLQNIQPNCHAKVYRVESFDINSSFPDELSVGDNCYISKTTNTVLGISAESTVPLWLKTDYGINIDYRLFIVHFQEETGLLFIYSQVKTESLYESIVQCFSNGYKKVPRNRMNQVLAGFSSYDFFNTGMQNRNSEAGESYRICSGSDTAASINEETGMIYSAGHVFCKVNSISGDTTIGYSSGSKIWSSSYLSIPEYIKWCDDCGKKIANTKLRVVTNTRYDILPIPTEIKKYQDDLLFCFFPDTSYVSPPTVVLNNSNKSWLLTDGELLINKEKTNSKRVIFNYSYAGIKDSFICDKDGNYVSMNKTFSCRDGRNITPLERYFTDNPVVFKASDGACYQGAEVLVGPAVPMIFDKEIVDVFNWDNTDTKREVKTTNSKDSIQESLKKWLESNSKNAIIIYDHGTGEVADFISVKSDDSRVFVELFHCKAKKGANYNSALSDIYEVSQQAVKSTIWVKNKPFFLSKICNRIRNNPQNKFVRGNIEELSVLLKSKRLMEVSIIIVQPAISKTAKMDEKYGSVLAAASSFIRSSGRAKEMRIIGSE